VTSAETMPLCMLEGLLNRTFPPEQRRIDINLRPGRAEVILTGQGAVTGTIEAVAIQVCSGGGTLTTPSGNSMSVVASNMDLGCFAAPSSEIVYRGFGLTIQTATTATRFGAGTLETKHRATRQSEASRKTLRDAYDLVIEQARQARSYEQKESSSDGPISDETYEYPVDKLIDTSRVRRLRRRI